MPSRQFARKGRKIFMPLRRCQIESGVALGGRLRISLADKRDTTGFTCNGHGSRERSIFAQHVDGAERCTAVEADHQALRRYGHVLDLEYALRGKELGGQLSARAIEIERDVEGLSGHFALAVITPGRRTIRRENRSSAGKPTQQRCNRYAHRVPPHMIEHKGLHSFVILAA